MITNNKHGMLHINFFLDLTGSLDFVYSVVLPVGFGCLPEKFHRNHSSCAGESKTNTVESLKFVEFTSSTKTNFDRVSFLTEAEN